MLLRILLILLVLYVAVSPTRADRVELQPIAQDVAVTVEESDFMRTVLRFDIGAFSREPVSIDNETYYAITAGEEGNLLFEGEPALPRICRAIIIPDDEHMSVNILASKYVDFPQTPVAPSKGNLPRTVNPEDVPWTFGPMYEENAFYPGVIADYREPFILRDYRGTVVEFNAFQYNPATQVLRVFTSVTLEIVADGPGEINVLERNKRAASIIPDFELLYRRRFINYGFQAEKYTPVPEQGDMLIITHDAFHTAMEPFVEWKMQKGMQTWMVDVSTIGNNGTAIGNYIQNFYDADSTNLAFVLLVGDHAQVNKPIGSGMSDPVYAKVAGSDDYPDLFIGRFSAETVADVETQVDRTIVYESNPVLGDWFHKGFGVASDDPGTGQGGEHDWEHSDLMRADLLNFTYTHIDQLYEHLNATAADVSAALNEGRGIGNYTGHGSATSWGTTGFSNTTINALTNDYKLPFIVSVACNNGQFDTYTCFGEAWLRAMNGSAATGAIGFYGSLISQSWSPPMDAQDEVVDILCAMEKFTFGGLCFNGACKMIDINGYDGIAEYNAWTVFGDPSVMVWTDIPAPMTVNHDSALLFGVTEIKVEAVGVPGALCALSANGVLFGSAYTDGTGNATIPIVGDLPIGQDVTLTVTAFNKQPYITAIPAVAAEGPFVVHDTTVIDDSFSGNANGVIDYGERIVLGMQLKNVGPDTAAGVNAVLTSADPYVTLIDDSDAFGDIPGNGGVSYIADAFSFDVSPDIPDNHHISFTVTMSETSRDSVWSSDFSLVAHAPALEYVSVAIDDASGNDNGVFDPGETVSLTVSLQNSGSGQADAVTGTLSETDPYVTVSDADGIFGQIDPGLTGDNTADVFEASADAGCPRDHEVTFTIDLGVVNGYSSQVTFTVIIGDRVVFFSDNFSFDQGWTGLGGSGEWTIGPATGGSGADSYGGADPAIDHSPTADNGVLGTDLTPGTGGDYANSLGTTYWVTSPELDCADFNGVQLGFFRWLGVESDSYDHVYLQVNDGSGWTTIFENVATIDESSWSEQIYDVSSYADSNLTFQIRFGIGPTDGAWNYCGWNIDDLYLKGYGERTSAEMSWSTDVLYDSLIPGDAGKDTLWVYNESIEEILRVRFSSDCAWMDCIEDQQYIDPLDSLALAVSYSTTGMVPGDYACNLTCVCNDYSRQYDTVSVSLHLYAPEIDIATASVEATLWEGEASTQMLTVSNIGPGRLEYMARCQMFGGVRPAVSTRSIPLGFRPADDDKSAATEPYYGSRERGYGGSDLFGYSWIDSDESNGPVYSWIDISGLGTAVSIGDDDTTGPVPLGMDFPFYDGIYTEAYIGSNGVLTFDSPSTAQVNDSIPDTAVPNALIAMWWDDLDPAEGGAIYYYADAANDRFIVSFEQIPNYIPGGGSGSLTFQAILSADGEIVLQYGVMDPGEDDAGLTGSTIGIENGAGDDGLEVVYNAPYMHDSMAIFFDAQRWLSVSPAMGVIEPYSSAALTLTFDASDVEAGEYTGQVSVMSNDPETPEWTVPVSLSVSSYVCGDATGDSQVGISDVVYIVNYVFFGGPAPEPMDAGDANADGEVNISDAIYIINYVFNGGPPPEC